jgi:16S rRNA (adenine1518-N6/adenine1519-N6)-dimethyltransferase
MPDLLLKTKELCRVYGITPSRSKGQNFLIREEIYDKMVRVADLRKDEVVLEVGPGFGFLTAKLAKIVKKVIAVELDDKLAGILRIGSLSQRVSNVEVVNVDILKISNFRFLISKQIPNPKSQIPKFKIVSNIPYNITSHFLRKFLETECKPEMMVLMVQKEVAERIAAKPGKMSILSVSVQFYADVEIVQIVPKQFFWPVPEVDSAIIKLAVRNKKVEVNERDFFRLVKFGFSARRKMLKNNLSAGYRVESKIVENWLNLSKIKVDSRAQDLSLEDWLGLFVNIP